MLTPQSTVVMTYRTGQKVKMGFLKLKSGLYRCERAAYGADGYYQAHNSDSIDLSWDAIEAKVDDMLFYCNVEVEVL